MDKVVLTGVKPTGTPHVGNYVGAIRPVLRLAQNYKRSFLFIADYHALNAVRDAKEMRENNRIVAATYLAAGLDPDKTVFYRQSDIPELFEITTILAAVTPKGLMDRSHAYKAAMDKNREEGRDDPDHGVNMGLYTYPILMAADILAMKTDIVPVGKDQVQHIEFARDMAGYFNNAFGEVLKLPEYQLEAAQGALLPGLDGRKMSKSYNNYIPIFMDSAARRKLVMKIVTDSKKPEEPKDPDGNVIFQLYQHVATPDEVVAMRNAFLAGGMGYGDAKQKLFEALERAFEEPSKRYQEFMADTARLDRLLDEGAKKARPIARATLSAMREAVGLRGIS